LDRATKLVVFAWCCAALATIVYFSRAPWPSLPTLAVASFAGMALLTAVNRRAVAVLLIVTYIFPIVIRTITGLNYSPFSAVWTSGLLGAMTPDILRTRWHVPRPWRAALVCWALTVVAGTLVVVLREFEFTRAVVFSTSVANSSAGGWPSFVVTWALHSSLVLLAGMLWFDWLCGLPRADVRPGVVVPLAASCSVMVAVAVYQLLVDVTALNPTVYGAIGRASGTVMDANLCGTIAGLWIGGAALMLLRSSLRYRMPLLAVSVAACWLAVWASGSRTGFGAAVIVSGFVAVALSKERGVRVRPAAVAAAVAAAIVAVVLVSAANVVGPLQRIRQMVPRLDSASLRAFGSEMWNRNGYGAIGTAIVQDFPVFGIGVGGFHAMQADFARSHGLPVLPPDNAQNWYRQQIAELGIVGSVGWIWWVVLFGALVFRRTNADAMTRIARGMVVAFAAISLVGMPGQEVPAAITFWLAAFWLLYVSGVPNDRAPLSRRDWIAIAAPVAVFAAGTAWMAATTLRVPARAQRFGWPYSYGFFNPETGTFGPGPGWTGRHAVAVFHAPHEWLEITVSADYRDLRGSRFSGGTSGRVLTRPSEVRLWCNGRPLLDTRLTTSAPVVTYVRVPADHRWTMLESSVSRGVPLRDLGIDADGEIGVRIEWVPAGAPPADTATCGA
jgi:O-antigen ligase